jgi:5-methyltetrahydrofolate--homocysteine methyltransferase
VLHVVKPAEEPSQPEFTPQQSAVLTKVHDCLTDFDSDGLQDAVRDALHIGLPPFTIIQYGMAKGMQTVGQLYEHGEYFLPDLVMAGATMQDGMQILKPALKNSDGGQVISKGKVVIGTVKGDMHDIGKNLVSTMLEGAQFEVIDLGVDVSPEKFVEAVRANQPEIVAMSALLTTTLKSMKDIVDNLQKAGLSDQVKIMIGGAPVSREYADQIGAQGYADSAVGAVYEAERLLKG